MRDLVIQSHYILFTGDVTSLYTNMDLDHTITVVRDAFIKYPVPTRPDDLIIRLLDLTLKNNDFCFEGKYNLQTCGGAMGKIYAPALANLYLVDFDYHATHSHRILLAFYFRYLDDIIGAWPGSLEQLKLYETFLGTVTPGVAVTLTTGTSHIDLLDVTVYTHTYNNITTLQTKTFFKLYSHPSTPPHFFLPPLCLRLRSGQVSVTAF